MSKTYFFYDLETSGLNPREHRVMQFAGIRTDENLKPIGEPLNVLVQLNNDILPSPQALMVTGIAPQKTLDEGYTEAQFAKLLQEEVFTPETVTIGFNNIRFDDEFIRHLFWRNFHDPYEWSWRDGRSRWDLLDVVRMTRALRPAGIKWPVGDKGQPTNRLELLTKENDLDHFKAHDALSDVEALIAIARLIKEKQPKIFQYLFKMRDKKAVQKLVNLEHKQPFVYSTGRYPSAHQHTSIAFPLTSGKNNNVVVYDLRHNPTPFLNKSEQELAEILYAPYEERKKEDFAPLPVKELQYNRSPAVAPLVVMEDSSWENISLSPNVVAEHQNILLQNPAFAEKIRTIFEQRPDFAPSKHPEGQLYDGFLLDKDRLLVAKVQQADLNQLADLNPPFVDERLAPLLLHYKARNFPKSLSESEGVAWEEWRSKRINEQLPGFIKALQGLSKQDLSPDQEFVMEELKLWAENVIPEQSSL